MNLWVQDTVQKYQDSERDEYLKKNGIKTIRISTEQIYSKDNSFLDKVNEVINHIRQYKNSLKIYQNIKSLDEYDDVFMSLNPTAFKYNNGTSDRFHFGFKAQDVKDSFLNNNFSTKDFGGFVQMSEKVWKRVT